VLYSVLYEGGCTSELPAVCVRTVIAVFSNKRSREREQSVKQCMYLQHIKSTQACSNVLVSAIQVISFWKLHSMLFKAVFVQLAGCMYSLEALMEVLRLS
jgi:hypothetical protein